MRTSQRPTQKSNAAASRNAFAGIDARADVAVDALETAPLAIAIELRCALDERERAHAAVIGGVERRERLVVAAEQSEIARALEIDHRLGRVRRARGLERRERVVVALQLALRLRDAQQAQPILGVRGQNLAILADRVVPAAFLERELGGIRHGDRCLTVLSVRDRSRPRATRRLRGNQPRATLERMRLCSFRRAWSQASRARRKRHACARGYPFCSVLSGPYRGRPNAAMPGKTHDRQDSKEQRRARPPEPARLLPRRGRGCRRRPRRFDGPGTSPGAAGGRRLRPAPAQPRTLETQTSNAQRWIGRDPADWVRARTGVDHNVVIVGGGQSGLSIAYQLRRKGVGRVEVIDRAAPGQAGIWRTIARMHQLRTPKTMAGPELGNPALSFRAWYETLNGAAAFDALDRIPRLAWADYLDWFQQVTGTTVRYGTRLVEIEPQGDLLRLHLETDGVRRVETTRKLVLANGYAGAGGPSVPDFIRALPASVWTHTTGSDSVRVDGGQGRRRRRGRLQRVRRGCRGARERRQRSASLQPPAPTSTIQGGPPPAQPAAPLDRGYGNMLELSYELPDVVRWRNFLLGDRRVASVPLDSLERAVAFKGFHIHLDSSVSDRRARRQRQGDGSSRQPAVPLRPSDRGDRLSHRSRGPARARAHSRAHRAVARPVSAERRRRERGGRRSSVPRPGVRVLAARRTTAPSSCATFTASTWRAR